MRAVLYYRSADKDAWFAGLSVPRCRFALDGIFDRLQLSGFRKDVLALTLQKPEGFRAKASRVKL